MKLATALSAAVALSTGLVLLPSAAQADAAFHADTLGDVRYLPADAEPNDPGTVMPDRKEGDVRGLRVNHLPRRVLVTLNFRDLAEKVGGVDYRHNFYYRFKTASLVRRVALNPNAISDANRLVMTNAAGKRVSCAMSARIAYPTNQVFLEIPRSCLGNPAWVRVGVGAASTDAEGNGFYDDAQASALHSDLVLGPRVNA